LPFKKLALALDEKLIIIEIGFTAFNFAFAVAE
jgi:hypothetical protein